MNIFRYYKLSLLPKYGPLAAFTVYPACMTYGRLVAGYPIHGTGQTVSLTKAIKRVYDISTGKTTVLTVLYANTCPKVQ